MKQAMRAIATVVALLFAGVAVYVGLTGSWTTAVLLFLIAGGVEFMAYAMGVGIETQAKDRDGSH
jgi:hypothetical protein